MIEYLAATLAAFFLAAVELVPTFVVCLLVGLGLGVVVLNLSRSGWDR